MLPVKLVLLSVLIIIIPSDFPFYNKWEDFFYFSILYRVFPYIWQGNFLFSPVLYRVCFKKNMPAKPLFICFYRLFSASLILFNISLFFFCDRREVPAWKKTVLSCKYIFFNHILHLYIGKISTFFRLEKQERNTSIFVAVMENFISLNIIGFFPVYAGETSCFFLNNIGFYLTEQCLQSHCSYWFAGFFMPVLFSYSMFFFMFRKTVVI